MATTKDIIPFEATHPGILIRDELEARDDLNQKELANQLDVKPSFLNEIIKGKRPGMKFQSQYEIDKARIKEKNVQKIQNIETWNIIRNYVPVNYFKKQGYLSDSIESNISKIKSVFSVKTIDELVSSFSKNKFSFFRKSAKLKVDEKNMFAWSALALYEAKLQSVKTYNPDKINQLCIELNKIFYNNTDTINNVKLILNEYGIKFVLIKKLEKTPVDGFSFWSGENPAIALTLRHSRIDNFAFTLMHEIAHISLHLQNNKDKQFLDLKTKDKTDILEKEADAFAQEKLIPEACLHKINSLPISDERIIETASAFGIHPAILLGRLCFDSNFYAVKSGIDKGIG